MPEPIQSTVASVSLITLAVGLFGPKAGPYLVIILGSLGGGLWALSSTSLESRMQGAWLMLRCVMTAVVLTALIASVVGPWLDVAAAEVYVAIAFVIGAFGNKWVDIFEAMKDRLMELIAGFKPAGKEDKP